jgi:hypothetical protein
VKKWESLDEVILRTYSLVGLRADVDFLLWRIAFDPLCFQSMEAAIRRSRLGAYLSPIYSFLSMQRRSEYVNKTKGAGEGVELLAGQGKFLFVYPFVKTRQWYLLSPHARQGLMDEHIAASAPFKGVHLNTSYSFGIDDQDFVVAFDSDYPQEFVDLGRAAPILGSEPVHAARYADVHVREGADRRDPGATGGRGLTRWARTEGLKTTWERPAAVRRLHGRGPGCRVGSPAMEWALS